MGPMAVSHDRLQTGVPQRRFVKPEPQPFASLTSSTWLLIPSSSRLALVFEEALPEDDMQHGQLSSSNLFLKVCCSVLGNVGHMSITLMPLHENSETIAPQKLARDGAPIDFVLFGTERSLTKIRPPVRVLGALFDLWPGSCR